MTIEKWLVLTMFVHDMCGQPQGVTFPTPSLRLQRLLGGSVAALLTANAFAVASLVGDQGGSDRLRRPAATGEVIVPTSETPPAVALITTGDGRTFVADPSTAEGRRAIDQARRDGGTVRNVAVPPRTSSSKPGTSLPLPRSVGNLLPKGTPLPGAGDDDGLLEIVDPDLVERLLQDPVGTATSIVQSAPATITSVVEGATSTVSSILTPVLPPPTAPPSPASSAPPLGLLGQVVTTVVQVVGSVTPTTAPPAPTSTPVCTLLVLC